MVKITVDADCGNSPKKEFLKQFNIAFAEGDTAFIAGSISDDITWNIVGDQLLQGKSAFINALEQMKNENTTGLTIRNIITHGKEAAADGEILMSNGKKYGYCDVYEFRSAAGNIIKSITSYVIETG